MRNILKIKITTAFLLFLFTFFSGVVQAQFLPETEWDENGQNHWSATEVGQIIANALTTSDSWQSAQSFFVKDQEGNFIRIDFALDDVVVTSISGSINFNYSDDEENLFYELVDLTELTPEELAQARATVQEIPDCPKWYVWDRVQCVLVPKSERLPCEDAMLSEHVYKMTNGALKAGESSPPRNTTIVPAPAGVKLTDTNTGFNSALYKVDNGNGDIEYVYATAGTDDVNDAWHDVLQATGFESAQYKQSVDNAIELQKWAKLNGYTLSFTGHSLGGGLANANALATGLSATIYNPAGLSDGTLANDPRLILSNAKNVTAHVVRGEIVSIFNYVGDAPVRGTTKYIGSAVVPVAGYGCSVLLGIGTVGGGATVGVIVGGSLHLMATVKSNLDCN